MKTETDPESQEQVEVSQAIYLHNHPNFIPFNSNHFAYPLFVDDLLDNVVSYLTFKPQCFRMSILFGYKPKMVRDGLYEVIEPVADARYILSKVFKRAFMKEAPPALAASQISGHNSNTRSGKLSST